MSEANLDIRGYEGSDFDRCKEIIHESTSNIDEEYSEEELEHLEREIPDLVIGFAEDEEFEYYVAEKNNEIVGIAGYHPWGKISGIFVEPEHQKEGIGKQLIQKIEREAKKESIDKLKVSASLTAKRFYGKLGYQTVKKKDSEIEGKEIPVYKMEKSL